MPSHLNHIKEIAHEFAIAGEFVNGEEIHSGHINSTYLVEFRMPNGSAERYVLQRINESVFPDPQAVMRNVEMVTRHINWKVLRVKRDLSGQTLNLYPARGGRFYASGKGRGVWRCYNFIEGCRTYDVVKNARQAFQAAQAFGSFQDLVSDIPAAEIEETIPDFHHTPKRYQRLMQVAAENTLGRRNAVEEELEFVRSCQGFVSRLIDLRDAGVIPERVTHNDTKINNVMMDAQSDEAVCVIDLDTVMPGLALYDFGDMIRTAVSPAAEDEEDLSKVTVRMPIFEALAEGYLEACDCLCDAEIDHLAFSGKLIALETGIRFLTDYLVGDVYFKTSRKNQNLDRARTQLKLVQELENCEPQMEAFVIRLAQARKAKKVG